MSLGTGVSRFGNARGSSIAIVVLVGAVLALMLPSPTLVGSAGLWSPVGVGAPARAGLGVDSGMVARASAPVQLADASRSLALGAGPAAGSTLVCGISAGSALTCSRATPLAPHPAATPIGSWINVTKAISNAPSGRGYSTMTYDANDGYVLLFGGIYGSNLGSLGGGTALGDTWTYQDGVWTDISPNISPSARELPFMAYDPADHEVVFFGGESSNGAMGVSGHNDTWTFANGTWVNITGGLSKSPSPRFRGAMAYDAYDGYLVLFGGSDPTGGSYLSDTWKFINNTWTSLTVTGSPPGRARASMAYDPTAKELVLYGGSTATSSPAADTWAYKSLAWTMLTPATYPNARLYYQMSTDYALGGVVLFGGSPYSQTGAVSMNDTWLFKGGTWTNLTKSFSGTPGKRGYEFLAYDPNGAYLVLYGGYNNNGVGFLYNDTWTLGPNLTVFARGTPSVTDRGGGLTFAAIATPLSANLTYAYASTPTGCASRNASSFACTPTATGTFNFTASATDGLGNTGYSNATVLVVPAVQVTSITFSPPQVEAGIVTHATGAILGGAGYRSYVWSGLPAGCASANATTLACTPTQTGSFTVRLNVTDQAGGRATNTALLLVNPSPSIALLAAQPAVLDVGMSTNLWANLSGGTAPFTYAWSNLPIGCLTQNLSPLPCRPSTIGTTAIHVHVLDAFGLSVAGNLSLLVNAALVLTSGAISPALTDSGVKVTFYLNGSLGTTPYAYTFTGLPTGCLPPSAAKAACIPHAAGTFHVVGTVTDAAGATVQKSFTLNLLADPVVTALVATPGTLDVGGSVSFAAEATLGTGTYTYAYVGLPQGCSAVNSAGFTCRPTQPGSFLVTVTATDGWAKTAAANTSLTIGPTLVVTAVTPSASTIAPGSRLTLNVTIKGGLPPYSYRYTGLPTGCNSQNKSELTCSPTATGSFKIEALVTDGAQVTALRTTNVSVQNPSSASSFSLTSPLGLGVIVGILVVAGVAGFLVMRRRRRSPPATVEAPPAE